jgi:protein translocase SecG subunit
MNKILAIIQLIISVVLMVAILFQNKGAALSATFGGDSAVYHTKRGFEKFLFILTIILSFLFIGSAFATLVIS